MWAWLSLCRVYLDFSMQYSLMQFNLPLESVFQMVCKIHIFELNRVHKVFMLSCWFMIHLHKPKSPFQSPKTDSCQQRYWIYMHRVHTDTILYLTYGKDRLMGSSKSIKSRAFAPLSICDKLTLIWVPFQIEESQLFPPCFGMYIRPIFMFIFLWVNLLYFLIMSKCSS